MRPSRIKYKVKSYTKLTKGNNTKLKKSCCNLVFLITNRLLVVAIFLAISTTVLSLADASSLAGSYSTRARGTAANYWNPANLFCLTEHSSELLLGSTSFNIGNNALSISRYNSLNGSLIEDRDKRSLLSGIDDRLFLEADFSHIIGYSRSRFALTAGINIHTQGMLSSDYVELLLFGNEYGQEYHFDSENNGFSLLLYSDITYGQGIYKFELFDCPVYTGAALSFLSGHFFIDTDRYSSKFKTSDDGLYFDQILAMKTATNGIGLKSILGLRTDISDDFTVSLVIDNAFGFITWSGENEETSYKATINNVYISDLGSDIVIISDSTRSVSNFTTYIYPSVITAFEFASNEFLVSFDWKQGFTDSVLSSKKAEIGMGIEYRQINSFPLRFGFKPGFGTRPHRFTYGLGLDIDELAFDVGIESCNAFVPSSYSQGIALSVTTRWKFR